jgi:hypothetical protein
MKPTNLALVVVTLAIVLVSGAAFAVNTVAVTAGAAMNGTNFGLVTSIDANGDAFVQSDHPNGEKVYRARFWVKPQDLPIALGNSGTNNIRFLAAHDVGPYGQHIIGFFTRSLGDNAWHLIVWIRNDDGQFEFAANIFLGGPNAPARHVEIQWAAATADGANDGMLSVNGLWNPNIISGRTDINNDAGDVDGIRIGVMANGNPSGLTGTYNFDEFESFRTLAP